jgi:hypothetical protein
MGFSAKLAFATGIANDAPSMPGLADEGTDINFLSVDLAGQIDTMA